MRVCQTAKFGIKCVRRHRLYAQKYVISRKMQKKNKKLSCRREAARRFMSLNISLSHSRLLKIIRNDILEKGVSFHIKRCHRFFHYNFYKYIRIFMIFGTQLCKWILIILVNLLRCVPSTSLTWWRNVDVTEITPFTVHRARDIVTMLQRETPRVYSSGDVAIQFARFESGGLQHLGCPSREGLPFADPWCKGVEKTSAERVEAAGRHHRGSSSDCAVV